MKKYDRARQAADIQQRTNAPVRDDNSNATYFKPMHRLAVERSGYHNSNDPLGNSTNDCFPLPLNLSFPIFCHTQSEGQCYSRGYHIDRVASATRYGGVSQLIVIVVVVSRRGGGHYTRA